MEPRILILDGNQRASLAAVRSLGSRGLNVTVGESSLTSLAGASKFAGKHMLYPNPYEYPREFFETIKEYVADQGISFLLPITEATSYVILQYRDELPEHVTLPFPDSGAVEQLANKNELFKLAPKLDIPVPKTTFCENALEGVAALSKTTSFPVVLKPYKSRILAEGAIESTQVIIANSRSDAESALTSHSYFNYPFTVQEYIEGAGQGVFALFDHGKPVCFFAHRRLREKPPGGGVSVLSESVAVNERLKQSAEQLLRHAKWHGVAMVEFRVANDGTGYLMEVNPRFWGSLQLAIDSGVDFPWLLYLISTGQDIPGIHWRHRRVRWLLGDLDRLYLVLKSPVSDYSLGAKFIEIMRFLRPNRRNRHEVNRVNDLRPFWFELKQYLRALRN